MQSETLKLISEFLESAEIPYDFYEFRASISGLEQYWVGEYEEIPQTAETGCQESQFILTGTAKESFFVLEATKQKIKSLFPSIEGRMAALENGSRVAIFYENAFQVPTEDITVKRMQINLTVKEWSVNEE